MLGVNLNFRDYFRQAMQGHSYTTGVVVGNSDAQAGLYYANPVYAQQAGADPADRRIVGVVVLRIKGSSLAAILDEVSAGGTRLPFMIDGDGVLVHYPDRRQLYRSLRPLPAARQKQLIAERRFGTDPVASVGMEGLARVLIGTRTHGNISYRSTLTGGDEYAGFSPVAGHTDLVVGVSESRRQFEAPMRQLFENVLYGLGIVGLVFLVLGILSARSIVRPVARLTEAANALKDGDYDAAHIEIRSYDELGRLARTFNIMIDVLRQRERERGRH
jgi:C4-dicarboxylate-specific signal transduction histidine kinase